MHATSYSKIFLVKLNIVCVPLAFSLEPTNSRGWLFMDYGNVMP